MTGDEFFDNWMEELKKAYPIGWAETIKTNSETQMSVQRVTAYIEGIPQQDELCFCISGYSVSNDTEIEEQVLLSMSEVKRLIDTLQQMTEFENENLGIKSEEIEKKQYLSIYKNKQEE